jgi:hypothetical protein
VTLQHQQYKISNNISKSQHPEDDQDREYGKGSEVQKVRHTQELNDAEHGGTCRERRFNMDGGKRQFHERVTRTNLLESGQRQINRKEAEH